MNMVIFKRILHSVMRDADTTYNEEEAYGVFDYYFKAYRNRFGEDHPNLRKAQVKRIVERMPEVFRYTVGVSSISIDPETYEYMIEAYLDTEFAGCVDYNINHFFSGQIRELLFYQHIGL